jgi:aldehyde:ferredoxin oxidoreductase
MRWFKEPLTDGNMKGTKLDLEKYQTMLSTYYTKRGWDDNGFPKKSNLKKLGLQDEATQLEKYTKMEE